MELDARQIEVPSDFSWRTESAQLLRQSIPNIATALLRLGMGLCDFVFVSRLGTDAQAAISPSTMFCFIIIAFGMAISTAVTTFASQAVGRREPREAAAFACQTAYVAIFFGLFSLPLMAFMDPLFSLFGHAPAVRAMEVDYCRIGVWCIAPAVFAAGIEGFFTAIRKPIIGTLAVTVALLCNALLNYVLIFGHFGAPALGIAGASIATVIGWSVRAAMLLGVFLLPTYAREFGTREVWAPSFDRLKRLFWVGAPTSIQWVADIGAWFVFMSAMMGRFGTAAMAATNICMQYMQLAFMPTLGVAVALSAAVGHAIGEGRPQRAVRRTYIACAMVSLYMGIAGLIYMFAGRRLTQFWNHDTAVIALGGVMMMWTGLFQVFDGFCMIFNHALRGAGDTRWPTAAFVVSAWGIFIGGGTLLERHFPTIGVNGPWAACTLYIFILGIALWARFQYGPWKKIKLFHDPVAAFPSVPVTPEISALAD